MSQKKECHCLMCGKRFIEYISRIKDGRGKYCSKKCLYKSKETYLILYCQECGREFRAFKSQVDGGREFCTKKCHEKNIKKNSNSTKYGRFFRIYSGILSRCNTSKKNHDIKIYQSMGIKCLWNSFEDFKNDMYDDYIKHVVLYGEKQTTIDRIDNHGNYCKENCRWATLIQQTQNRNISLSIVFNGENMNYSEFARRIHRSRTSVYKHLKSGKTPEEIYNLSIKYDNKGHLINK